MSETWAIGVTREPPEPASLESMIESVEQISKTLPECWHHDLITSEWLPKSANGTTYACAQCFKLFTAPESLVGANPPKRLHINLVGEIAHEQ